MWSFRDRKPREIAALAGFSNHRIGENFITGGVRQCGDKLQMIVPDLQWSRTLAVTVTGGTLSPQVLAEDAELQTVQRLLSCDDSAG